MILVTLEIFSGRENPKWMLSKDEEVELQRISGQFSGKGHLPSDGSAKKIPSVGYRGFRLKGNIFSPDIVHRRTIFNSRELELFLLSTAQKHITREVFDYVKARVETFLKSIKNRKSACPICRAVLAPSFGQPVWKFLTVELNNNCYNYCTNLITNTFAQPGKNSATPFATISGVDIEASATGDGLIVSTNFTATLTDGHYVALVIWPGIDFHWYRQDSHGCWSHKAGNTPVTNTDNSNQLISDPRTCDLGPYTFHSFMIVNGSTTII
jgi:hypothetical protein